MLYRLVQQLAATFFAHAEAEAGAGADLPRFVKDEFVAFLECGILANGLPTGFRGSRWRTAASVNPPWQDTPAATNPHRMCAPGFQGAPRRGPWLTASRCAAGEGCTRNSPIS